MALNFPNTPTDGQQYTHEGRTWEWSASLGVWSLVPVSDNDAVVANAAAAQANLHRNFAEAAATSAGQSAAAALASENNAAESEATALASLPVQSATPPENPLPKVDWINTTNGKRYTNVGTTSSPVWVEVMAAITVDNPALVSQLQGALAADTGAAMVGFKQDGVGAVDRTVEDKAREIVSVKDFGAVGDGITDDQGAIELAVSAAISSGASLDWPAGTYISTDNIPNFHDVHHTGVGIISRAGALWHITPNGSELNIIHVSPSGSTGNDGLGRSQGITLSKLNDIVRDTIGPKASDGVWRAQLQEGEFSDNGIRLADWPVFRNPFQFWGEVATTSRDDRPLTVWKGKPENSNVYAVLAQNISAYLHLDFRYICFEDWLGANPSVPSSNAGGVVVWNAGKYYVEFCWFIRCSIGFAHRYSYAQVVNCRFEDNRTWGTATQYNATSNIGSTARGNIFINSQAHSGRFSVAYVVGNTFDQCQTCIEAEYMTRINTSSNEFSNWTTSVYGVRGNSLHTMGENTYLTTPTREAPVWWGEMASVNPNLHRGVVRAVQSRLNTVHKIENQQGERLLLSSATGDGNYSPFRLPGWALYSPDYRLELELVVAFSSGAGGLFELAGASPSEASVLASYNVPVYSSGSGHRLIRMVIEPRGANTIYSRTTIDDSTVPSTRLRTLTSTHRSPDDGIKVFRLYYTPAANASIELISLRTWFEG